MDSTTGTVKFKAVFPNTGNELFQTSSSTPALLVEVPSRFRNSPASAIQRGPRGLSYVVKADKKVAVRPV